MQELQCLLVAGFQQADTIVDLVVLGGLGALGASEGLAPWVGARTSPATLFQLFLLYRYRVATMDRRSFPCEVTRYSASANSMGKGLAMVCSVACRRLLDNA